MSTPVKSNIVVSGISDNIINQLQEQIQTLSNRVDQLEKRAITKIVKKLLAPPELQKIQLHQQTFAYHIDLLDYLPMNENVKAVLLTVKLVHENNPNGHAYLGFQAYQQRRNNQATEFIEQTYNAYYTVHQQELIVPWDSSNMDNPSSNLVINVTSSYNTGTFGSQGNLNHFEIKITGYIV
jgi:hypothetical protein